MDPLTSRCVRSGEASFCPRGSRDERGFSLMEAVVATAIAIIAIMGMAHSFGIGRALVNRYELGRVALGAAQQRMDWLTVLRRSDPALAYGQHDTLDVVIDSRVVARESWLVTPVDDPADGLGGSDPVPQDLRRVTVTVTWGDATPAETIQLSSLLSKN